MPKTWFHRLLGDAAHGAARAPARRFRPQLESLEDRCVPALAVTDLTGGLTPTNLVQNLVGAGVTVSNVTYTGDNKQGAEFTGGTGIIGFEAGVVLSTGHATDVIGPNNNAAISTNYGNPGDPQLDTLVAPSATHDACVLQFDFVPQGSTLKFNYVFSSDEYNQFVAGGFNDVFAFYLNGTNVALLPGTNTPVSIGNVNLTTNPQFYINNATSLPGETNPATPPLLDTQMDGLTVVLSVNATVNPGVVNHIKLAIADTQDGAVDSNVFIQAGSFAAPMKPILTAYRPLRYAFRTLEQNEGQSGPTPLSGTASQPTYDGIITVLNTGNKDATGPITFNFTNLPVGVTVVNATGIDPKTNDPFITVSIAKIPQGGTTPFRFYVKLSDPLDQPLDTFFIGGYLVDAS